VLAALGAALLRLVASGGTRWSFAALSVTPTPWPVPARCCWPRWAPAGGRTSPRPRQPVVVLGAVVAPRALPDPQPAPAGGSLVVGLVRAHDVDVLTPQAVDALDAAGLADLLPHRVFQPDDRAARTGLACTARFLLASTSEVAPGHDADRLVVVPGCARGAHLRGRERQPIRLVLHLLRLAVLFFATIYVSLLRLGYDKFAGGLLRLAGYQRRAVLVGSGQHIEAIGHALRDAAQPTVKIVGFISLTPRPSNGLLSLGTLRSASSRIVWLRAGLLIWRSQAMNEQSEGGGDDTSRLQAEGPGGGRRAAVHAARTGFRPDARDRDSSR